VELAPRHVDAGWRVHELLAAQEVVIGIHD
jgi:hypothetical protein